MKSISPYLPSSENPIPAVVVGADLNALGVLRSLAAGRVRTYIVGREDGAAMHSRFGHKHKIEDISGEYLMKALLAIGCHFPCRPVLFLTEEKSVQTVSERREEIFPYYRITLAAPGKLASLMDKTAFQALAQEHGALIPKAIGISKKEDLHKLDEVRYPCVLKPAYKHYGYGELFQKAYVVNSSEEAARRWQEIAATMPDLILQEWIEGNDSDIYFCLQYVGRNGETVASFVGRKLRSWPPRIGGTASCIAAPEFEQELTAITASFFRTVGFVGMGSMEFKRSKFDGRFYMVEPTVARTDFQEEVATVNGVNIPLAAYCHEIGVPPPAVRRASTPRLWREPVTDRWAREVATELLPEGGIAHEVSDAYFRVNDPGPWLQMMFERISTKLRHLI
jgi:D-aspartate ligase